MSLKRLIIIIVIAVITAGATAEGRTFPAKKNNATLLELFYGMETDDEQQYVCPELDSISGLIHKEFKEQIVSPDEGDEAFYDIMMCLYIDEEFPSEAIRRVALEKVDELLPLTFKYQLENDSACALIGAGNYLQPSTDEYIKAWQNTFENTAAQWKYYPENGILDEMTSTRTATVCHKVYEDNKYATYLVEFSYDYHGSCGCPSQADYYTIDKQTGKILNINDVVNSKNKKIIEKQLESKYRKALKNNILSGSELIKKASGVALINEGLLFYYHPYEIGGGADGEIYLICKP